MKVYLVRHGEAVEAHMDPSRPLDSEGIRNAEKVARFLKQAEIKVEKIWHSKKKRAQQTAEIIKSKINSSASLIEKDCLSPNDSPQTIFNEVIQLKEDVMIVGHLPFLDRLTSLFVIQDESNCLVVFNPATTVILEGQSFQPFRITSVIQPDML